MDPRSLQFVVDACGGTLVDGVPAAEIRRVVTDSRSVQAGDLFVALKGERFDAHDFLPGLVGRPGLSALVARGQESAALAGLPRVVVEDTRQALGRLAAAHRRGFGLPVVCVGGSNGKTTTKELIASVAGARHRLLKSEASFNNDIGVPLTLLGLESSHEAAVLEAGTNHPGELAPLIRMIAPRLGVITSIGREHLEFFGDLDGVVREEGALAEGLPAAADGGVLFLDGDSPHASTLASRTGARVVRVGFGAANDWSAEIVSMDWTSTRFRVRCPHPEWSGMFSMNLPGRHSVPNALYALAVSCELGVEPAAARDGLAVFRPASHRLACREVAGVRILDDSYNANADSMLAALRTFADLPCTGRRWAVLGDMAELGEATEEAHREVGRVAVQLGIGPIVAVGCRSDTTLAASGRDTDRAFGDAEPAARLLLGELRSGDAVLVKASRSSALDRIVDRLLQELRPGGASGQGGLH
ncbi:MAG: UDP-N-acetylmuramoyl-tripeptide--D-alanyl-D-alanine ligase [Limisphaerales bacterium]